MYAFILLASWTNTDTYVRGLAYTKLNGRWSIYQRTFEIKGLKHIRFLPLWKYQRSHNFKKISLEFLTNAMISIYKFVTTAYCRSL